MTWTDQGLALRKALEGATREAEAVHTITGIAATVPATVLRAMLDAHPVDEGPLRVKVVDERGKEVHHTVIEVILDRAYGEAGH